MLSIFIPASLAFKLTSFGGPCNVKFLEAASCNVRLNPGNPPICLQLVLVKKTCSMRASPNRCSCANRCVPSPQLIKYLQQNDRKMMQLLLQVTKCNVNCSLMQTLTDLRTDKWRLVPQRLLFRPLAHLFYPLDVAFVNFF